MSTTDLPPGEPPARDLPPKREVALVLLQSANSVYVHLDPRHAEVMVPTWFRKQPQLVLQVGLNMAVPIVDLDVGEEALSCTLSFNRAPHYCFIPWDAVYALVDPDGRGMVWPDSVPPEVARASGSGRGGGASRRAPGDESKAARPRLRLAKDPEDPGQSSRGDEARAHATDLDVDGAAHLGSTRAGEPTVTDAKGGAVIEPNLVEPGLTEGTSEPAQREAEAQDSSKRRPPYLRLVK